MRALCSVACAVRERQCRVLQLAREQPEGVDAAPSACEEERAVLRERYLQCGTRGARALHGRQERIRSAALRLEQQEQRATQLGHACLVIRAAAAAAAAAVPSAIFTPGVTAVAVVRREANELREVQLHELAHEELAGRRRRRAAAGAGAGAEGGIVGGQLLKQVRENLQLPCRRRVLS